MTMFVVPGDRPHSRPEFRPHRREGGEQHVRESRSEPDSLVRVRIRVNMSYGLGLGGISFLKTVNTLLSESTEGRTGHKGGRAFARTIRVRVRLRGRVRVRVRGEGGG